MPRNTDIIPPRRQEPLLRHRRGELGTRNSELRQTRNYELGTPSSRSPSRSRPVQFIHRRIEAGTSSGTFTPPQAGRTRNSELGTPSNSELGTSSPVPPLWLTRILTFLAYGIPLAFLAYVLYINYLPFGYEETFTIDVGAEGDTDSRNAFYLEPSPDLGERMTAEDGTTYRELNGMAYAVFKPDVVLKDAEITVSVEGEGVSIIPPVIDFNPDDYEWDYEWDFTKPETAFTAKTSERARAEWTSCTSTPLSTTSPSNFQPDNFQLATSSNSELGTSSDLQLSTSTEVCEVVPVPDLVGNAFFFDNALTFNGRDTRLELPTSADKFEDGPFTVYVEWTPKGDEHDGQQIVGHYNWELWQNRDSVEFRVGRMDDIKGPFYSLKYSVSNEFFYKKHSIIAIYYPSNQGYFEFFIDNIFIGKHYFDKESMWTNYGNENLSLGKSKHGIATYLQGTIHALYISNLGMVFSSQEINLNFQNQEKMNIPLTSNMLSKTISFKLKVVEK